MTGRRRTLVVLACLLPGSTVVTGVALAAFDQTPAKPSSALQAVDVTLGTNSSVNAISATLLTKSGTSLTSSTTPFDPASKAGDLPVSVALAYTAGGHSGTDIKQAEGLPGPVEIDVTVTNTTVHPQSFPFNSGAGSTFAQVATPLTVVASATLPAGSVTSVTQPATGVDTPHTTNGLVGRGAAGATTVQWSAVLAPPRLSPSTTFRLVVDTPRFALAGLNISVQPGLQSDTSVGQLLSTAFSGNGSLPTQDGQTISLVRRISDSLISTTRTLNQIQTLLVTNATTIGSSATDQLKTAGTSIMQDSTALQAALSGLQQEASSSVSSANDSSKSALSSTVSQLIGYLGLPAGGALPTSAPTSSPSAARGCAAGAVTVGAGSNLLDQLGNIAQALNQVAADSTSCSTSVQSGITTALGDVANCPQQAQAGAQLTVACALSFTSASLGTASAAVLNSAGTIINELNTKTSGVVAVSLAQLRLELENFQTQANTVAANAAAGAGNLALSIVALSNSFDTLSAAAANSLGAANGLASSLSDESSRLVATTQGNPQYDLQVLASEVCELPTLPVAQQSAAVLYAKRLRALVTSAPCPGTSPVSLPSLSLPPISLPPISLPPVGTSAPSASATSTDPVSLPTSTDLIPLPTSSSTSADSPTSTSTASPTSTSTASPTSTASASASDPATGEPSPTSNGLDGLGTAPIDNAMPLSLDLSNIQSAVSGLSTSSSTLAGQLSAFVNVDLKAVGQAVAALNPGGAAAPANIAATTSLLARSLTALYNPALAPLPSVSPSASSSAGPTDTAAPAPSPTDSAGCLLPPVTEPLLNSIGDNYNELTCSQGNVVSNLTTVVASAAAPVAGASDAVGGEARAVTSARATANAQVQQLLDGLTGELTAAGSQEYVTGAKTLHLQQQTLSTGLTAQTATLDSTAKSAIAGLTQETTSAGTNQKAASSLLSQQIATVLGDLGSGTGNSGLLGTIANSANSTGQGTSQIQIAAGTAGEFTQVRDAQLSGALLADEVNQASLALTQTFPLLGPALPAGVTHTSVFEFHVAV